jgi:hypothetical protein
MIRADDHPLTNDQVGVTSPGSRREHLRQQMRGSDDTIVR